MAGKISGEVNAKLLILNHISPKVDYLYQEDGDSAQLRLIKDAKEASNNLSKVLVAYDFMELPVPWLGFGSLPEEDEDEGDNGAAVSSSRSASNAVDGQPADAKQVLQDWFGPKS
jgi:hypothetical protein